MPDIHELLDQLSGPNGSRHSTQHSGYRWQRIAGITAFLTREHGLLRWKALPMGFKNASAYFQREIDAALGSLRLTSCVAYIDDICIYSTTLTEHLTKVKAVLKALRVIGFSGNPAKCFFAQREVIFLGHRVADGKIFALHDKIKGMLEYQRPTSLTELRAFLGLMSYYRRFIKDFATIAAPLTELTKFIRTGKSQRELNMEYKAAWQDGQWTEEHDRAFEVLKGALITRPILALPVHGRKWRLATDASKVAMGAVLSQINEQDEEHPIAYYSRKLTPTEAKWDIWELELAAVVWATAICRHYLRATRFELVTDSKVVQALLTKEVPTRRANLVLRLSEFEFTVTHRKGEHNANADFMSRWAAYKDWSKQKAIEAAEIEVFALPLEPGPDPKSVNGG